MTLKSIEPEVSFLELLLLDKLFESKKLEESDFTESRILSSKVLVNYYYFFDQLRV